MEVIVRVVLNITVAHVTYELFMYNAFRRYSADESSCELMERLISAPAANL